MQYYVLPILFVTNRSIPWQSIVIGMNFEAQKEYPIPNENTKEANISIHNVFVAFCLNNKSWTPWAAHQINAVIKMLMNPFRPKDIRTTSANDCIIARCGISIQAASTHRGNSLCMSFSFFLSAPTIIIELATMTVSKATPHKDGASALSRLKTL